jgi:hypothetical protein
MTNRTITRARLSDGENTVLQAIRRWRSTAVDLADVKAVGPEAIALAVAVRQFMDLLRDADPYVVQVRRTDDEAVTLFELQLLYAIAECRAGNADTTAELLDWWFPIRRVSTAHTLLAELASVVDMLSLTFNSRDWVRGCLLAVAENRVKTRPALAPGSAATSFGFWTHRTQTFH